jgi:hypothetical protein
MSAGHELSQAIAALSAHHAAEPEAFAAAAAALRATLDDLPDGDAMRMSGTGASARIVEADERLRDERAAVLGALLAVREQLADATHVEPEPAPAPPVAGTTSSVAEGILAVAETYRWTHAFTLERCIDALGPLYVLGRAVEQPVPLREAARAAEAHVRSFAYALGKSAL